MSEKIFKDIHHVLESMLNNYGIKRQVQNNRILNEWDVIVGKALSKQCKPLKIEKDILFLKAKTSVWRNELSLRQMDLINLINNKFGKKTITRIRFL